MIRLIFLFLILIHALVNLMGFLKAFKLAEFEPLTLPITKISGLFWLLVFLLLLISAVAYMMNVSWWWMIAAVASIVSQVLIILYWQDAKFGTIANIIILAGCLIGYGSWNFNRLADNELQHFWSNVSAESEMIAVEEVKNLPPVVQRWMNFANVAEKENLQTVYFKQSGQMRTSPEGKWMPVEAEQYVKTQNPGFLWIADVEAAPYIHLTGRDKYVDGKGHMLIKLFSLFPVADSKGPQIDQGTLLRYLAEMVWYPSAALEEYISWKQLDNSSAEATMSYGGVTGSGIFTFDEKGRLIRFEADRYYDRKEGATLEPWVIAIDAKSYQLAEEIQVPTKAEVTWRLDEGDFTWYKLEISDIRYQ